LNGPFRQHLQPAIRLGLHSLPNLLLRLDRRQGSLFLEDFRRCLRQQIDVPADLGQQLLNGCDGGAWGELRLHSAEGIGHLRRVRRNLRHRYRRRDRCSGFLRDPGLIPPNLAQARCRRQETGSEGNSQQNLLESASSWRHFHNSPMTQRISKNN